MGYLQYIVLLLFIAFFTSSIFHIVAMLARKREGARLERDRILFFFFAILLLVCLVPLGFFDLLSTGIVVSNVCVVLANLAGFVLTFSLAREESDKGEREPEETGVRAYQIYYEGQPYGVVTKEGFDCLMAFELLKKQRTVELISNYKDRARAQGVNVVLLQNRDGSQRLLKVETPEQV